MALQKDEWWRVHKGLPVIVSIGLDCDGRHSGAVPVDLTEARFQQSVGDGLFRQVIVGDVDLFALW